MIQFQQKHDANLDEAVDIMLAGGLHCPRCGGFTPKHKLEWRVVHKSLDRDQPDDTEPVCQHCNRTCDESNIL